jgi:hypothetical protein
MGKPPRANRGRPSTLVEPRLPGILNKNSFRFYPEKGEGRDQGGIDQKTGGNPNNAGNRFNRLPMKKNDRSFWALMTTQFLGAFNDNVFQIVIALLITHWMTAEKARSLVAISGGVFAAPFLLFSLGAGRLADRWSKARVVVVAKDRGSGGRRTSVNGTLPEKCAGPLGRPFSVGGPKRLF